MVSKRGLAPSVASQRVRAMDEIRCDAGRMQVPRRNEI